jgi:hypothetical protein
MSIDFSHAGASISIRKAFVYGLMAKCNKKLPIEVGGKRSFRVADEISHNAAVDTETQLDVLASTAIPESFPQSLAGPGLERKGSRPIRRGGTCLRTAIHSFEVA